MNEFKRRPRGQKPEPKKREFSKQVVAAVLLTYFIGVAIGAVVVLQTAPDQLYAYLTFIGAPTATTVGFYAWKAKNENMNKHAGAAADPAIMGEPYEPTGSPDASADNDEEA